MRQMNISQSSKYNRIFGRTFERYEFDTADIDDVDGIVALWPEHWEEAHYKDRGIVPDEARYRKWMKFCLYNVLGVWIVAKTRDNEIVGYINYELDHNFSVEPVAVMGNFFVAKAHRRTAVPAILFELALDLAKGDGACAFHAPIASETLSSRALENSFIKHGFTVIGTMMGRQL
jgi:GNAT superfamily N-acetyltransferase